jgi:hypothetical protein
VEAVREFVADWRCGKAGPKDLPVVAADLEVVRSRLERVRALHPECRVGLGEEVEHLLKLLGRQRSVAKPRLVAGLRRAAGLL